MPPTTRVSAVSYLNTCPLVWGFLHGPQSGRIGLRFELPAECAESLRTGSADVGLVPVIEAFRQSLDVISDVCIASDGAVRSIFLVHKVPVAEIRSIAMDASSRTSVCLTRILLAERYGVNPAEHPAAPDLNAMLKEADAALLIGDPALRIPLPQPGCGILDLGAEWKLLTGLPMVYAVWAGHAENLAPSTPSSMVSLFRDSYEWGKNRIDEIVRQEAPPRQVSTELALAYLTSHIKYELDIHARRGLSEFQRLAGIHGLI